MIYKHIVVYSCHGTWDALNRHSQSHCVYKRALCRVPVSYTHLDVYKRQAVQGVAYCDKLFRYERRYKEQGHPYEQRQKRRLKEEKPVVGPFIKYILEQRPIYKTSDGEIEKIAPWSDNVQKTCR